MRNGGITLISSLEQAQPLQSGSIESFEKLLEVLAALVGTGRLRLAQYYCKKDLHQGAEVHVCTGSDMCRLHVRLEYSLGGIRAPWKHVYTLLRPEVGNDTVLSLLSWLETDQNHEETRNLRDALFSVLQITAATVETVRRTRVECVLARP